MSDQVVPPADERPDEQSDERGAALVEMALVVGVLVLLVLGAAEWGFAFKDWLGVSAGTRAGARVAAQAGDETGADCLILESTAGAIRQLQGGVVEVWIHESDTSGTVGASQRYRPAEPDDVDLVCGTWVRTANGWPEGGRDNDGDVRDWVGVRVVFDHDWLTGFPGFTGSVRWNTGTVMHIEPDPTPDFGP